MIIATLVIEVGPLQGVQTQADKPRGSRLEESSKAVRSRVFAVIGYAIEVLLLLDRQGIPICTVATVAAPAPPDRRGRA